MDVCNMFHQLVLPKWLSYYLPLMKVRFGDLSGPTQRTIIKQLDLAARQRQNALFRPHLRTMPMGFSWAVFVAHGIASTLLRRCISGASRDLSFSGRIVHLSKKSTHRCVGAGDVIIGHIIDDVCAVGYGDTQRFLIALQAHIWTAFSRIGLPIKVSKSKPLGSLVADKVTFIGFQWDFLSGILKPKDKRCRSAAALRNRSDHDYASLTEKVYQSLIGKVIWLCVARRSLLSLLRCAVLPCALDVPSARTASGRELRQFGRLSALACINTHRPIDTLILSLRGHSW